MQNIFPAYPPEEVVERVKERWDLSGDFPLPKAPILCPHCFAEKFSEAITEGKDLKSAVEEAREYASHVQARCWQFVYKDSGGAKYRCNVCFKCTRCSLAWTYGIVIPKEMFDKHRTGIDHQAKMYHWREVQARIR